MARDNEPKDIQSEVLYLVKRDEFNDGQKAVEIRVVDWIVGGKHYPQLEKREFYIGQEGEWKMGKAKGFGRKDLLVIASQWTEIMGAVGATMAEDMAPPVGAAAPAAKSAASTATAPVSDKVDF